MKLSSFFSGGITPGIVRANKAIVAGATKQVDVLDITTPSFGGVPLTATALQLNQSTNDSLREVGAGATKTLTVAANNKQTIKLDTLAGSVVTLPAATGSGARFLFLVTLLATSNSHIVKVANSTDVMIGIMSGVRVDSGNAVLAFPTVAASDTITLNRTTTGSVSLGEWFELEDVAAGFWSVRGVLSATGAAFATPFSATV